MSVRANIAAKVAAARTRVREGWLLGLIRPAKNNADAYELLSDWADRFGYLILLGLAVELGELWVPVDMTATCLKVSQTVADGCIALGVWGELHLGGKARIAADAAMAETEKNLKHHAVAMAAFFG